MMMDFWSIWMDGFIFVVETKEFLVQHCILTAFSCWQCLTTFWVTKKNWLDKFTRKTKKRPPFTFDGHDTAFSCWKDGGHDCRKPDPVGVAEALLDFFSLKNEGKHYFFALGRVSRHPHPRARFSKSPPRPRQIKGPELRPAASTLGLWNASWPGLWLWKLCPGPGVSAVQQMCGGVSDGRWLTKKWWSIGFIVRFKCMYTCMYVYMYCWNKMFKIFLLFRYSGEKVAQMG